VGHFIDVLSANVSIIHTKKAMPLDEPVV